jgi:hypothetical protein
MLSELAGEANDPLVAHPIDKRQLRERDKEIHGSPMRDTARFRMDTREFPLAEQVAVHCERTFILEDLRTFGSLSTTV